MARSTLTESINKVRRLVTEIRDTLTVDEFNLLLDELLPEPEPETKPAKKTRKKPAGKKSARASGMVEQLSNRRQEQRQGVVTGNAIERCVAQITYSGKLIVCDQTTDDNIHHITTYPNYHPFTPAASTAAQGSTPASSGIDGDGVGDVHHAASSGD